MVNMVNKEIIGFNASFHVLERVLWKKAKIEYSWEWDTPKRLVCFIRSLFPRKIAKEKGAVYVTIRE